MNAENVILFVTLCSVRKVQAPQTHQSVVEISKNVGIHQWSVGRTINDLISYPPRGKQRACLAANVFLGSVAITHLR